MATANSSSSSLQTTTNFGVQNWQSVYSSSNADLASYDFETLRQSMLNYLKKYNPESYNDFLQQSELMSLVDLIAYMGQAMSYRFDLNARETFITTAQTRNAINSLANLVNYTPSRNLCANGYLKILSISLNENVYDNLGNNLNGISINWNDATNKNWQDQWNTIINAILSSSQTVGNPSNSQTINGIDYSEYGMACASGQFPPYSFSTTIDSTNMNFEIVNPTSVGETYIYEVDPNDSDSTFNILYLNDDLGYSSQNTGYFLYFKQGLLSSQAFSLSSALPNTTLNLTATGVNNTDVWLYQVNSDGTLSQWVQVDSIYNSENNSQNIFSVTNLINDGITLVFGDGVFGDIPQGNFICYTRSSNGLTYRINPSEMSNVTLSLPYNSKTNRSQLLKARASLQYTVGNSATTETLANIKLKAPQNYYTQNRMVNGQDYNYFPFTKYSNILQIKSVNRISSGISRYLDVVDPTGKYSSTNAFCDDGFLYMDDNIITSSFTYANSTDLATIVETNITNMISTSSTLNFILSNYSQFTPSSTILWNMTVNNNTSCSGWIEDSSTDTTLTIYDTAFSDSSTGNASVLVAGAVLTFDAPSGYVFDKNNSLITGSTNNPSTNQKTTIYATIIGTPINDGLGNSTTSNGVNVDGSGAITLNQKVPTGAVLSLIYPYFSPSLPSSILQSLITDISAGDSIALTYYPNLIGTGVSNCWTLTTNPIFPINYSPATYGTDFTVPTDTSDFEANNWLLAIVPSGTNTFTVYQRNNAYYFGSESQTSFYLDTNEKIYDPDDASSISDKIVVLKSNSLTNDVPIEIFSTINEINGTTIDTSRVGVQYNNFNATGFPSNPTFFTTIVGASPAANNDYIFFVTDKTESTTTILSGVVIEDSPSDITDNLYSYANGTIVFCLSNKSFYQISRSGTLASKTILNNTSDTLSYTYYLGRQDLDFQYIHYAADNRRIDPSPSNLIDIYILEQSYATSYQQYITDTTGQISEPTPPTTDTLSNDFYELSNYKMISDELIFNSAQFVPLFGDKADASLQASLVAVPASSTISSGEIASQVITAINDYFTIGNFQFGQTFYWAQLSNYLMNQLGNLISSIHLVPTASNLSYGDLEEITCNPYEIFISCATVQNVTVVSNVNSLNLRIS
ncbi:Uncharacterised protein [uncultured archaeon]|nr:Uncharacterised protein [uncultured archaeon]